MPYAYGPVLYCKYCLQEKDASLFDSYHKSRCKECSVLYRIRYRQDNLERLRAVDRARNSLPHRVEARKNNAAREETKAKKKQATKAYLERFPDRRLANEMVDYAIRRGRLVPWPVCAVPECCCTKTEAHHPDYSMPLDVVWLCRLHHRQAHALVTRYSPRSKTMESTE